MIKTINIKQLIRFILMFICFLLILSTSVFEVSADKTEKSDRIIVSMGDSYSSGEGIDNFYDYDLPIEQKVKSQDWLAHRSQKSWGGQLMLPGVNGKMADEGNRNNHWYFVAASGAETKDIMGMQKKTYNKEHGKYVGYEWLPPQLSVFDQLKTENKKADYVTLTLGGNDLGFTDVIKTAVVPHPFLNKGALADQLNTSWEKFYSETRDEIKKCYQAIWNASEKNPVIIVAGYPKLLDEGNIVYELGNGAAYLILEFDDEEVKMINESVSQFNNKIKNIVNSCKAEGMKICFVSVEEDFDKNKAYSEIPYINEVSIGAKEQDIDDTQLASSYSVHPNEKGAEVYRACVQKKIDELEKDGGHSEWSVKTTSEERDIVLVLDTSGSMAGNPMEETKKASLKFINTVLEEDASIGIVTYENAASVVSDFSVNENSLKNAVNDIGGDGGTNIEEGLKKAHDMLSISKAKKKIIVLMSDGEPNSGKVGDELASYADSIKNEGTYIYTLGFFQNMGNSGKSSAQMLMEQIASDGCHYEVSDADDLVFFFGDIADQINGQKYIYVRIACPVDVTVEYDGEKLCSSKDDENVRTSFGSLTFEDSAETYEDSRDGRVKILRLKDDFDYDIKIEGNGRGSMDYTIGFMDENGEYSDLREFNDVKINKRTRIDTVAKNASSTVLKVDSDGDGKYDLKYKAKANGVGEIVDYSYVIYIAVGILILIGILIIYIKIKKWNKRRIANEFKKKSMKKKFCVHCGSEMTGEKAYCENCGNKMD